VWRVVLCILGGVEIYLLFGFDVDFDVVEDVVGDDYGVILLVAEP